jgi:thioredoxin-like negative regulator of GroEL
MPEVVLYHREGCGLCQEMLAEIMALKNRYTFALAIVDIDEDPDLQARFNAKVPVLAVDGDILCCHFLDRKALVEQLAPA